MSQEGGTRSHSDETEFYGWCGVEDGNRSTNSDKGGWTFFRDQDFSGESDEDGSLEEEKVWEAPKKPRKLKSLAKERDGDSSVDVEEVWEMESRKLELLPPLLSKSEFYRSAATGACSTSSSRGSVEEVWESPPMESRKLEISSSSSKSAFYGLAATGACSTSSSRGKVTHDLFEGIDDCRSGMNAV